MSAVLVIMYRFRHVHDSIKQTYLIYLKKVVVLWIWLYRSFESNFTQYTTQIFNFDLLISIYITKFVDLKS